MRRPCKHKGGNKFARIRATVAVLAFAGATAAQAEASERMDRLAGVLGLVVTPSSGTSPDAEAKRLAALSVVDQLVENARSTHPKQAEARAKLEAAEAQTGGARAAYQPTLGLSASASRGRSDDLRTDAHETSDARRVGLVLRQNLWRGGQDSRRIGAAEANERIVAVGAKQQEAALALEVASAAYQYNRAAMQLKLAREAERDAEELLALSERKYKAGQAGRIDVQTSQMRLSEQRSQSVQASLTLQDAFFRLLDGLGARVDASAAAQKPQLALLDEVALPDPRVKISDAPQQSLQEESAGWTAEKAELELQSSYRSRYLPELDFVADVSRTKGTNRFDGTSPALQTGAESETRTQQLSFGLELNWPLWARPKDFEIRAAAAEKRAAETQAADAVRATRLYANQLTVKSKALEDALGTYRDAYKFASDLYDAQMQLYKAGAVGIQAVVDADSQRLRALRSWYDARCDAQLLALKKAALAEGYVPAATVASGS